MYTCYEKKGDVITPSEDTTHRFYFLYPLLQYWCRDQSKMSKTNIQKLHRIQAGIRSTISMFIVTAEESKKQLNIQQFRLALEELEMEKKILYKVNEKIMSATDAEHIKEEIINTRKKSFKLKLKLMELRDFQHEVDTEEIYVNQNSQTKQCTDSHFEEQIGIDGAAESQNNSA